MKISEKAIKKAQKALHKQIDTEVSIEKEIHQVADYTTKQLLKGPFTPFQIQGRTFIVVMSTTETPVKTIMLSAREKLVVETGNDVVIKAKAEIDMEYSFEENISCCVKALLGHITGYIKPEQL